MRDPAISVNVNRRQGAFSLEAAFAGGEGVTALFGPSGSGKSTILGMIAGLTRPDRGRIEARGRTFFDSAGGVDLDPRRRRVGLVFQEARLFPHMSVRRNLLYGYARRRAARRIEPGPVIELLGIGHLLERRPRSLSGGERQRVALGRALLAQPELLLMDEPLAALDAQRKGEILAYIEQLRHNVGIPILYVSHALEEVLALADTLVLLDQGRIADQGPTERVAGGDAANRLLGRREAGSVLPAVLREQIAGHRLSLVEVPGGALYLPHLDQPPGARLRIRIRARDVAIARSDQALPGYSALNRIEARIAGLTREDDVMMVSLAVGDTRLLAALTTLSVERLGLQEGDRVTAVIKTVSLAGPSREVERA